MLRVMLLALIVAAALPGALAAQGYYGIQVVDASTGRGVPLVELETPGSSLYVTDSGGWIALDDPALMNRRVYFHVRSHGYLYPADGFGYRGVVLDVTPGGQTTVRLPRVNLAERLYRITGANIYGDSLLLGKPAPTARPVENGLVMGQDSVAVIPWKGALLWTWGDTGRFAYPLGNFHMSGATSELPEKGGLDPDLGVDLHYYVDAGGFSRPMCPIEGPGPVWAAGSMVLRDETGHERLATCWSRMKDLGTTYERGFSIWNDEKAIFEKHKSFDLSLPLYPTGQSLPLQLGGQDYYYFAWPYPMIRVRADWKTVFDPENYEAFTPLRQGSRYERAETAELERDAEGRAVWGWKRNTGLVGPKQQGELIRAGALRDDERQWALQDVDGATPVLMSAASVHWNPYRGRWIMIGCQMLGTSMLGEIWFSEADTPVGPWAYARKVVTHDRYSFYNPTQHPFFDRDGGRVIYFEGTYTEMFSGNGQRTPYYDYNQIMYKLALDDPRLALPAPVYECEDGNGRPFLAMRESLAAAGAWGQARSIHCFALPPEHPTPGGVALYAGEGAGLSPRPGRAGQAPLCYGLAPDSAPESASPAQLTLYLLERDAGRMETLLTSVAPPDGRAVARLWPSPFSRLVLDADAAPRRP